MIDLSPSFSVGYPKMRRSMGRPLHSFGSSIGCLKCQRSVQEFVTSRISDIVPNIRGILLRAKTSRKVTKLKDASNKFLQVPLGHRVNDIHMNRHTRRMLSEVW